MRLHQTLIVLGVLSACTSIDDVSDLPAELRTASIVAVHNDAVPIPETGTFSWMSGSRIHDHPAIDRIELEGSIRRAIEDGLRRRGYFAAPGGRGDLWVGFVGGLEESIDDLQVDRLLDPDGLAEASTGSRDYGRGALVVDIVDRKTKRSAWRGSITVLANPELPEHVRRQRVELGIEQLLSQFRRGY